MSWSHYISKETLSIVDKRILPFKSFCRKCSCHHPSDSEVKGFLHGCICNPAGRRGECGRYVPTDSLEFLEYIAMMKEKGEKQ